MRRDLIERVDREVERAIAKWGEHDQIPDNLISAAVEELGETAHAINHNEGVEHAQQEICETIGVLARLYDMVELQSENSPPGVGCGSCGTIAEGTAENLPPGWKMRRNRHGHDYRCPNCQKGVRGLY